MNEDMNNTDNSEMIYVVLNGDGTGDTLGGAISNNDIESLQSAQGGINDAHNQIEQWVTENGGQIISSSGDESIFTISRDHAVHLDKLIDFYQNTSQHSATIGIGDSISNAVKAIVYGKNNGRGAVNEYTPEMESMGAQEESSEMTPMDNQEESSEMNSSNPMDNQEEGSEEGSEEEMENDYPEMTPEDEMGDNSMDNQEESPEMSPMDEKGDMQEPMMPDNQETNQEESSEMNPMGENQAIQEENSEMNSSNPMDNQEEGQEEGGLKDVLQSHLQEEDGEMEGADGEQINHDPEVEGQEDMSQNEDGMSELKNEIGNALEQFQMNKDVLESHKNSNPELYGAMLTMVGAMIHMSKMLGLDSAPDQMSDEGAINSNPIMEQDKGVIEGK